MSQIKHRFIAATYQLLVDRLDNEELLEETPEGRPLQFYSGFGMVLKAFEEKLVGESKDSIYDITLTPNEAYGEYFAERVVDIPRENFLDEKGQFDAEHIYMNARVPMENEDGTYFEGRVVGMTDDHIRIDFNAPLAGKTLHFTGIIKENREATDEEITQFIAHLNSHSCCGGCGGEGGCGSEGGCGGGCGHCKD